MGQAYYNNNNNNIIVIKQPKKKHVHGPSFVCFHGITVTVYGSLWEANGMDDTTWVSLRNAVDSVIRFAVAETAGMATADFAQTVKEATMWEFERVMDWVDVGSRTEAKVDDNSAFDRKGS